MATSSVFNLKQSPYSSFAQYGNTGLGTVAGGIGSLGDGTYGVTALPVDAASPSVSSTGSITDFLKSIGAIGSTNSDNTKTDGWGSLALGAAQGLGSAYLGLQQYGLAKDTLANNKAQFALNYAANKTTTNAPLEDRQRARVASNPTAYQSVSDYMAQNGVK